MIPTYRSEKWIRENWRILSIKKNRIVIGDQCSEKNHLTSSGKMRLCLPLEVIKRMLKTKEKEEILKKTIRKKIAAPQGKKIPLDPEINRYIKLFYKGAFRPRKSKKIIVSIKNNKIVRSKNKGIKLDSELFKTICSDPNLKNKFVNWCKQKQLRKAY